MKLLTISLVLFCSGLLLAQQPGESDAPKVDKPPETGAPDVTPKELLKDGAPPPLTPDGNPAPAAPSVPADAPPDAGAPPATTGDAIPQNYRSDRYESTWQKNPFLIKVAASIQATASFAEDWELKYLSERNGVVKAGIQNRKTQEFRNVTSDTDSEGFHLVKATISRSRKESVAEIGKGAETATFKYSDTAPPPSAPGRPPIGQGQLGGPVGGAVRPGMPVSAGAAFRANGGAAAQPPGMQRAQPQQPGVNPGGAAQAPGAQPSPVSRRRVLIPSPVPPTAPVP